MQPGSPAFHGPPPVVPASQVRPSLAWFWVAGGLAVVGIGAAIAFVVMGVVGMQDMVEDFTRIAVPGSGEVRIDDAGGYSVYQEYRGADADSGVFAPTVSVTVTDPSGAEVPLEPYTMDVTYDTGRYEGVGVFTFDADEPGVYQVTTSGDAGSEVAVGRGLGRRVVRSVVAAVVVGFLGVVGGAVMAIVVGVRRSRNRRLLQSSWAPPPGPPGPPGGWPQAGWPPTGGPPGAGWPPGPGGSPGSPGGWPQAGSPPAGGAPPPGAGWPPGGSPEAAAPPGPPGSSPGGPGSSPTGGGSPAPQDAWPSPPGAPAPPSEAPPRSE